MDLPLPRRISKTFGDAYRYSEPLSGRHFAKVMPGALYVTTLDEFVSTTLGSCVAVVLHDIEAGVAGMNHYLLPNKPNNENFNSIDASGDNDRYGEQAMASLVEGMLRCGARTGQMKSKIFGGGRVLGFTESIGTLNATFAKEFLQRASIPVLASDVGGTVARKIILDPKTGQVRVQKLAGNAREKIVSTEKRLIASTST